MASLDFHPKDIITHMQMCVAEGASLQRGMNFRLHSGESVVLMSVRKGAPYHDRIEGDGSILIYEGHDAPRRADSPPPKTIDQPLHTPHGKPTQNALFYDAAQRFLRGEQEAQVVRVYEKIKPGIWEFSGVFRLIDAWREESNGRKVFRFKLELTEESAALAQRDSDLPHSRLISSVVKQEVWKRDKGQCVICRSKTNLHFDHELPYSLAGTSISPRNIRLLCARHNLSKGANIE
jgi:hypothetical protein